MGRFAGDPGLRPDQPSALMRTGSHGESGTPARANAQAPSVRAVQPTAPAQMTAAPPTGASQERLARVEFRKQRTRGTQGEGGHA